MPGLITHYICGDTVYRRLGGDIAAILSRHRGLYNVGCQGPDIFFYYITSVLNSSVRGIGERMHKGGANSFVRKAAEHGRSLAKADQEALFAYLSGFLGHYALDCAAHPYVYCRTGYVAGTSQSAIANLSRHIEFEAAIDALLLKQRSGKFPHEFRRKRIWHMVAAKRADAAPAADAVAWAVNETYGTKMSGKHWLAAMDNTVFIIKALQSKGGKRKKLLEGLERLVLRTPLISALIHPQSVSDCNEINYLNNKNGLWHNPWDENAVPRRESFAELMEMGAAEGVALIEALWQFMFGAGINGVEFADRVGDKSFGSGLLYHQP